MAETTGIDWCDATFNPWVGCEKVSPGCAHCYAETLVTGRMDRPGTWGEDGTRQRTSDGNWKKPLAWEKKAQAGLLPDGSSSHGRRPRVFCASLADVFEPRSELRQWRYDLFGLIEATPGLDWLLLTKRPEEARDWLYDHYVNFGRAYEWFGRDHLGWGVLPNVWVGTSIENARFTWRADVLREIPAAVRFISAEPLLSSLLTLRRGQRLPPLLDERNVAAPLDLSGIDWLIVGGESGGRDARPMHPEWARELRDACLDGIIPGDSCDFCRLGRGAPSDNGGKTHWAPCERPAFFFKQWGSYDESGRYVGSSPKAGGKLLDGREWCEFPAGLVPALA